MADDLSVPTNGSGESHPPAGAGLATPEQVTEIRALTAVNNILTERLQFMRMAGITHGGLRDEYQIFGYDRTITGKQYRDEYARGGIAGRIVDAMPNATWRGTVELIEDEDPEVDTAFEQAWQDLDTRLQIQAKLLRVDKLAGLSTFAVLLIGAPGDLNQELPKGRPEQLLYLSPFSGGGGPALLGSMRTGAIDADCLIKEFDVDPTSPRFGLPLYYQLRRTDITSAGMLRDVHWTRVIHIAENLLDDEVYGQPALERVWNLLIDLRKVTGGGAEAFWLRANQGLHIDVDKEMSSNDAAFAIEKLKEQSEAYKHQIDRWLRTKGTKVEVLGSDVANFESPADAVLTQIAGAKGIPKRVLTGSEMGELASSQDRDNWKDQVNGRQTGYAGPYIVRPLVDRLIAYGYLPIPKKGPLEYTVRWPQIQTMTEPERTAGAQAWAATNQAYGDVVFTDAEIREKWADKAPLTPEQRDEIAERQAEKIEQAQAQMAATTIGQAGVEPGDAEGAAAVKKLKDEDAKATIQQKKAAIQQKKVVPFQKRAAEGRMAEADTDEELVRVLASAIEAGAVDVITAIVGLGGAGSGNFGHAGRPGLEGGSAPSGGASGGASSARQEFNRLKNEWARINDDLLSHLVNPNSPEALKMIAEQKAICKQIHRLEVDPEGHDDLGLPGGVRDTVIVGAGPGGLAAAVASGPEGLDTLVIEASTTPGGQPKHSSRIENYPGFPAGASGQQIAETMHSQAERVGAETKFGVRVDALTHDPATGIKTLTLSDGQTVQARTVIVATGVDRNLAQFPGAEDVLYSGQDVALKGAGKPVIIAGGSNGAAQAALGAAQRASHVTVISRSPLATNMSDAPHRALRRHPKISVIEGDEIAAYDARAETVHLKSGTDLPTAAVGVFFGGTPNTGWLPPTLARDGKRIAVDRNMETNIPGVFAIGDSRSGTSGRIGTAVGDGLIAVHSVFDYFARTKKKQASR